MITQSLLGWFAPPPLARPDLRRRARALWIVSWPFFAVVIALLGLAVVVEPATLARRAMTVGAVGALMVVLHMISRSGRPVLASWMLVLGLSIIVTQRAWITGGIHAPVAVFYVIFIVMAAVLIGTRGGVVTAAVCAGGAVVLTIGTSMQWLTPRPGAGSALGAFVFTVLAIGLALVLQALLAFRPRRNELGIDATQMLVHDMRAPIQVVRAHLELLRDQVGGDGAKDVEGALDGAATLQRMTNSLLDVGQLDAGQLRVNPVVADLSLLAQSVVTSLRIIQPERNIAVVTLGDPQCTCDPELTRRIIENLVGNAMKHSDVQRAIRVVISGSRTRAYISVKDDGPGIAPEMQERLFEPFSAGSLKSANGYESSGLGLVFCKLAAEAQGGIIRVEDAPRGSVFIVELPRRGV